MDDRSPGDVKASEQALSPSPEALAGWCEAASRLLAPLLASPQAKARLRILLQHVDPDYAPALVRTLVHTDPELPLAALWALPRFANLLIEAAVEATRQLAAFPPALLGSFVSGLVADLRPRPLGEALGHALRIVRFLPSTSAVPGDFWSELAVGFSAGYVSGRDSAATGARPSALAAHAQGLAAALASLIEAHPELASAAAGELEEAFARHPALLGQGLVPLLVPLHEALHAARDGAGASR